MLGSIQSGRCHLGFGLALADWIGHGGPREEDAVAGTRRSTRSVLGSVEFTGFFFPSMRLFPDRDELYAACPRRTVLWFSW
jgi:hypothetical protein